ncbi:type II secretion system protein [Luteolibacter marinus]|uniref:type II secretion system protein n=1 Tax=Luteolibacter marinus TaxID=2776705 RepID=UPI001868ACFE|nr:prepilin-type N-terminal cleavage/methylation domain-containing protein [Luteolibacter marinus]
MKKPKSGLRTKGFTLVELLVVIVIIAALAALVFSMAKKAMDKSRLANSLTKVRDLGVRVQGYTQDNAGQLPVWKDQSADLYWWGMLIDDPENESQLEIFHSPAHKEFSAKRGRPNLSYGWNATVVGRFETAEGDDGPKRMVNFKDPARILVLADGEATGGDALIDRTHLPDEKRYNGRAAGLLLDGSGKELLIERDFKSGASPWFMTEEEREMRGE